MGDSQNMQTTVDESFMLLAGQRVSGLPNPLILTLLSYPYSPTLAMHSINFGISCRG